MYTEHKDEEENVEGCVVTATIENVEATYVVAADAVMKMTYSD